MLKFLGIDLELFVDEGSQKEGSVMWSATGIQGDHWLIVQVDCDPDHLVWVCAPVSVRALHEVTSGRATPRDAVQHSATGTVEVVTVDHGRAVADRCLSCRDLPDDLLPAVGSPLGAVA